MRRRSLLSKAAAADLRPGSGRTYRQRDWLRSLRRTVRRLLGDRSTETRRLIAELARRIETLDWDSARQLALELGAQGETRDDRGLMMQAGRALRRLGVGTRAWQLLSLGNAVAGKPEWDGKDLEGRTLLVERRGGDLAVFLKFASLLSRMSTAGGRCIVLVEPRIEPLYRRTFPFLDVRPEGDVRAQSEAETFASFETLAWRFWPDDAAQRAGFVPLLADPAVAGGLRSGYSRRASLPLVGLAWGSMNRSKTVPALSDWRGMLTGLPGGVVSLQYGNVAPALAELDRLLPGRVLFDPTVDQLVDMDRFAAQLAAMDVVVTISNTGAHLAGAMGVPCVVLLDDQFRLAWPQTGNTVPFYPRMKIVRKNGRGWDAVMTEARTRVEEFPAR